MESTWILKPVSDEEFEVNYSIDFEFHSRIYSSFTTMVMDHLGKNILKSFLDRLNDQFHENQHLITPQMAKFLNKCELKAVLTKEEIQKIKDSLSFNLRLHSKLNHYISYVLWDTEAYIKIMKRDILVDLI